MGAREGSRRDLVTANGGTLMAAGESALVPISPDDSIESIATRIRGQGATHVQLLVPDGTAALQSLGGFQRLLQKLAADHVSLLLISSDEQTLNAARRHGLSPGRVSQKRREFHDDWQRFTSDDTPCTERTSVAC